MLILSIISYFIAAIYFFRVFDATDTDIILGDAILDSIIFLFWPIVLVIGISLNAIRFKHFILAITSFFKD